MRVMIFGDSAVGKSTFASKLAGKLDIPVIHLDEVMEKLGREDRTSIEAYIKSEADKDDWIIDGNAFTKDRDYRLSRAELVIVFDSNRFITFAKYLRRYYQQKLNRQTRVGATDTSLNLLYFIPYIFIKFPPRKRRSIKRAKELKKEVVILRYRKESDRYLAEIKS